MGTWRRDTPEAQRALAEERAVLQATELISHLLDARDVKRIALADRLGISRSEISQRLNGQRNLTVKSLAAMLHELGYRLRLGCDDLVAAQPKPRTFHFDSASPVWAEDVGVRYTASGSRLNLVREPNPSVA